MSSPKLLKATQLYSTYHLNKIYFPGINENCSKSIAGIACRTRIILIITETSFLRNRTRCYADCRPRPRSSLVNHGGFLPCFRAWTPASLAPAAPTRIPRSRCAKYAKEDGADLSLPVSADRYLMHERHQRRSVLDCYRSILSPHCSRFFRQHERSVGVSANWYFVVRFCHVNLNVSRACESRLFVLFNLP